MVIRLITEELTESYKNEMATAHFPLFTSASFHHETSFTAYHSFLLQGSELVYFYACIFLFLVPLLCAGAGYCVVKLQDERKRKFRMKQEEMKTGTKVTGVVDKMSVREWLHANHKRFVKLRFGPDSILYTVNRKGEKLRSVNFTNYETITIEESQVSEIVHSSMVTEKQTSCFMSIDLTDYGGLHASKFIVEQFH